MERAMLIGIAGGTGSGKSTFAEGLRDLFPNDVTIIAFDNYYKPQDDISFEERLKTNYDCPDALDTDLLIAQLEKLVSGDSIDIPVYDFCVHTRKSETERIEPRPIIIVDGILTFHDERLRAMFDLKIFADADADERILRRLRRDVRERGRVLDKLRRVVVLQMQHGEGKMEKVILEHDRRGAKMCLELRKCGQDPLTSLTITDRQLSLWLIQLSP